MKYFVFVEVRNKFAPFISFVILQAEFNFLFAVVNGLTVAPIYYFLFLFFLDDKYKMTDTRFQSLYNVHCTNNLFINFSSWLMIQSLPPCWCFLTFLFI